MILLCNDVEPHPGPFFEKAISGFFYQSHPNFGINRGKQCASIALYSVAFSTVKRVERWMKENLDSLLEFGDDFFTSLNIPRFLGSEDLPKRVPILQHGVNIDYTFNTYGILSASEEHTQQLNQFISNNIKGNTGFLMWIGEVTIGIMFQQPWSPVGNTTVSTPLVVIDSHSRNERGEISDTGASILMTFSTVNSFVQYIVNTYIQQISLKAYQLQFVHCKCTLTSGQCCYVCSKHVSLEQKKVRKAQDKERIHVAYTQRKEVILKKTEIKIFCYRL